MQTTVLFKATGRSSKSPIVILTGPNIGAKYSTTLGNRLSRTLSAACKWVVCNCAPHKLIRAAFSGKAIFAVAVAMIVAMMWHNITINDPVAAGEAVAYDCIYAMPWLIVWTIRATLSSIKEGGEV